MSKYQEKIVNATTGEITFRDYSDSEILEIKTLHKQAEAAQAEVEARAAARQAVLEKLGLTADEAAALLA
jgi:hypothetical protein